MSSVCLSSDVSSHSVALLSGCVLRSAGQQRRDASALACSAPRWKWLGGHVVRTRWVVVLGVLAASVLVGCGDDDDTDDAAGPANAAADATGFCPTYVELSAGKPTAEEMRALADKAPQPAATALNDLADGLEADGDAYFQTEEAGELFTALGEAAAAECADSSLDVTAVDFGFQGMPTSVDAGLVGVNLTNEGNEFHEFVVFRKADAAGRSFDEILALGQQEAAGLLQEKGGTFAAPGGRGVGLIELGEPGEYMAVCFIPLGSTPESEGDGLPHFTEGMKAEFTVN